MILGYVEAQLPTPIPIPGVKLGLANLVNILMLFSVGPFPTAVIGFLRIILLSLLFGNALTLSYSLSGFLCSFLIELSKFYWAFPVKFFLDSVMIVIINVVLNCFSQFILTLIDFSIVHFLF